jgi:hypothetical protein
VRYHPGEAELEILLAARDPYFAPRAAPGTHAAFVVTLVQQLKAFETVPGHWTPAHVRDWLNHNKKSCANTERYHPGEAEIEILVPAREAYFAPGGTPFTRDALLDNVLLSLRAIETSPGHWTTGGIRDWFANRRSSSRVASSDRGGDEEVVEDYEEAEDDERSLELPLLCQGSDDEDDRGESALAAGAEEENEFGVTGEEMERMEKEVTELRAAAAKASEDIADLLRYHASEEDVEVARLRRRMLWSRIGEIEEALRRTGSIE